MTEDPHRIERPGRHERSSESSTQRANTFLAERQTNSADRLRQWAVSHPLHAAAVAGTGLMIAGGALIAGGPVTAPTGWNMFEAGAVLTLPAIANITRRATK